MMEEKRNGGLPADYRDATPEDVARAVLKYRPERKAPKSDRRTSVAARPSRE